MDKKKIIIISAVSLLALTGVGLGLYAFLKSRKLKKQNDGNKSGDGNVVNSGQTLQQQTQITELPQQQVSVDYNQPAPTQSSTSSGVINPFGTTAELKAFQKWVFDTKGEKVGKSDGTPDGKWGGKTSAAWTNYGTEYLASLNQTTAPQQQQQTEWSSSNWEAGREMYMLLYNSGGKSLNSNNDSWSLNLSGQSTNTVIFSFYYNGFMDMQKKGSQGLYAKKEGSWKKVVNGFKFTINNQTYTADYTAGSIMDTLYRIAKDANYYRWSDGTFVEFTKQYDDFLNMTEDKNKQKRIEVQF
jgi:hypothetical protein